MSCVYFIAALDEGMVKIGFAGDPWRRLAKIQSDCPHSLTMLGIENGSKLDEAELHQRFGADRLRGEWFQLSERIKAYAAALPTPIRPNARIALGGALGAWMFKNNHTVHTAGKLFGLPASCISRMCAGKHIPRREAVARIYELTNGEISPNDIYAIGAAPAASRAACMPTARRPTLPSVS